MKTIIAGSRTVTDYSIVLKAIQLSKFDISEVVSGGARGADSLGERFAKENKIPVKIFPANWEMYGKKAGFLRNREMAEYGEALIAIMINNSKGTSNMISLAKEKGLKVYVLEIEESPNLKDNSKISWKEE